MGLHNKNVKLGHTKHLDFDVANWSKSIILHIAAIF